MPPTPFTAAFKRIELGAIGLAVGLAVASLPAVTTVGMLNLALAFTMLVAADLVSGGVHWAFDRWGTTNTPIFGPNLIRTFREHHTDPLGITRHSFVEANGGPALGAIPILIVGLWGPAVVTATCFWLAIFVFFTNVIHSWAHGQPPSPVRWLQRRGVLLSPEHLAAHHSSPHDRAYCITTGWMNPLLDSINAWERLERLITATVGLVPNRG